MYVKGQLEKYHLLFNTERMLIEANVIEVWCSLPTVSRTSEVDEF